MEFTAPDEQDLTRLAQCVVAVNKIASRLGLPESTSDDSDLDTLQTILDSEELQAEHTYELQALGVVLGRVLVRAVDGLEWAIVSDEYGTDPTLRYRETPLCINVLTTISKRVEDGERVDVRALFSGLQKLLADTIPRVGGTA